MNNYIKKLILLSYKNTNTFIGVCINILYKFLYFIHIY